MKETMKKLLIILLMLISATTLFAVEGEETTTNPNENKSDELIVTTTVDPINYVAIMDSSSTVSVNSNPEPLADQTIADPSILKEDGFAFKVGVRTNMHYEIKLSLSATPMTGKDYAETHDVTISVTNPDGGGTPVSKTFSSTSADTTVLELSGADTTQSKLRAFEYSLKLTTDLTEATADTYKSTVTVEIQPEEQA